MEVGFVGLGQMGAGMAQNMLAHRGSLSVCDPRPQARTRLVEAGAVAMVTPQALAERCDVVFLCLPDAGIVRDVILGEAGLVAAGRTVQIVDTSTLDVDLCRQIGADAEKAGLRYVDCPVSGMPPRAEDGTLMSLFGGSDEAYGQVLALIETYSQSVIHCGPLGAGQMAKAFNNIIYDVHIAALAEVLPLMVKAGLPVPAIEALVLGGSAASAAGQRHIPKMARREFSGDFAMQDAYKDIENVQKLALEHRAMMPVVNAMTAVYQQALSMGYGQDPKSAMIKLYEAALGVRFERQD